MDEASNPVASIERHFSTLVDPRQAINQDHLFLELLVIAICAIIAGADDWEAVADFGRAKIEWFKGFLSLPHGIPSHDTFWRVFRLLDPEQFQQCFLAWIQAVSWVTQGEVIAIDGKKLRRSHDKGLGRNAIHMVSAWASATGLTLGQRKVDDKSNEITAIPALLEVLELAGCIVTIDAMGCQTEIAQAIVDKEADYLLALKANQGTLYEDVILLFDDLVQSNFTAYAYDHDKTVDKDHGRIEVRQAWTINDPAVLRALRTTDKWPKLRTLLKVQAERYLGAQHTLETRYYLSSLSAPAAHLLAVARTHWSIENGCHWVLDIAFREDECRLRKDHGPQNFAILRHIAHNCLKQERSAKLGVKNKRLRAGWDNHYLLTVLSTLFS
jgi:predicted transposase YbfD/YdcC